MGIVLMDTINSALSPLKVLIVGCGNIAGGFDQGRPSGYFPYTHAGAYVRDDRFVVAACVEPDDRRREEFMSAWQVPVGFRSIGELLDSGMQFDVISICSPTSCHAYDLEAALCLKPRLIFCEKPIATSLADAEKIVMACSKASVHLAVNYTRRWDPYILKIRSDISAGLWGQLRSVLGIYNKGILNNGSHLLDLLYWLVGPMKIINVGKPVQDFFPADPTVPIWLETNDGVPVHIACGHAEDYAIFELQLVFSLGVLTMEGGGMFWRERRTVDSDAFKGYRQLDEGVRCSGKYPKSMLQAIDNMYRTITQGAPLASSGKSALVAQRACEEIKQQACLI